MIQQRRAAVVVVVVVLLCGSFRKLGYLIWGSLELGSYYLGSPIFGNSHVLLIYIAAFANIVLGSAAVMAASQIVCDDPRSGVAVSAPPHRPSMHEVCSNP